MSGSTSPGVDLATAQARLASLRSARSSMVLGVADGVQQYRYPDGSGLMMGTIPERLTGLDAVDREIALLEQAILRLTGARPRRRIRQVRIVSSKGYT